METQRQRRTDLYGSIAFGTVIVACYSQFLFMNRINAQPWQVLVLFGLGALYTVTFLIGGRLDHCEAGGLRVMTYYVVVCAIVTALLFMPLSNGFFFSLIGLPVVSQALFDLRRRGAILVITYLYAASVATLVKRYGIGTLTEAMMTLAASYAFTIAFTTITVQSIRAKRESDKLRTELEAANAQLRAHAAEAEELATTRERNRLAREIHDGVGHYLTVIKVQLDAAEALLRTDPARAGQSVTKAARLAAEALDDVRRSVGTLAADAARPPLADSLRALAGDDPPSVTLRIEGAPRALSASAEHALYRTAQEGLTNVRKHSAATAAELTLDYRDPARVRLTLRDNGRGTRAAPAAAPAVGGYGLRGLRERIALLGGTLDAGNGPAGGFALTAEVPA